MSKSLKFLQLKNSKIPLKSAIFWILFSVLFVSGSAAAGLFYYRHIRNERFQQPQYNIIAIVQTTPDKERLKTIYLAEILNLSIDNPTNLFRFNAKEAQKTLLGSSFITKAHIKKILPNTIYIDYTLRKPVAYLLDYTNTMIDREGICFPFKPFFTPKKIPEIYLGLNDQQGFIWGEQIKGIKSKLALYLIDFIQENCCAETSTLARVDVSNALADSFGQKQIIAIIEDRLEKKSDDKELVVIPQILRLSTDNYRQELANYVALRPELLDKAREDSQKMQDITPIVVDLRIPELAFISGIGF